MRIDATPKDCCLVRESLNTRKFSSVKYGIYIYILICIHYWYYNMSIVLYFIKINGSIHAKAAKATTASDVRDLLGL